VQQALTLVTVAMHEGEPIGSYQKRLGVSSSVVSAHILELGPKRRNGAPGLGLVEVGLNPVYMREHLVTLTPRGRELVRTLVEQLTMSPYGEPPSSEEEERREPLHGVSVAVARPAHAQSAARTEQLRPTGRRRKSKHTTHLKKRGNTWYVQVAVPPTLVGKIVNGGELPHVLTNTLETQDIHVAARRKVPWVVEFKRQIEEVKNNVWEPEVSRGRVDMIEHLQSLAGYRGRDEELIEQINAVFNDVRELLGDSIEGFCP
jgi:hypothetical protein